LRRNCFLKHVIEGKIEGMEVTGRRGRRLKQLLDDLTDRIGYYKSKEEVLDRTVWRIRFGRVYGPVVRQTADWMKAGVSLVPFYQFGANSRNLFPVTVIGNMPAEDGVRYIALLDRSAILQSLN
jgi:hypothetical protein